MLKTSDNPVDDVGGVLKRFTLILTLAVLVAGVVSTPGSTASFNDSSPCPASGPLLVCPTMYVGQAVHLQLLAHDGCELYRWEMVNGGLPAGLSMSSSGLVTGTPTAPGTTQPWVIVHDVTAPEGGHPGAAATITRKGSSSSPSPAEEAEAIRHHRRRPSPRCR